MKQYHNISPIYDKNSKILILGSFPSVKSREHTFFYAHTQNRFWKVISAVYSCSVPNTIDEKKEFLLENNIAVWDVIKSCDINGSSDSSITNVVPNNVSEILNKCNINKIFVNGHTAEKYYKKYIEKAVDFKSIVLPSTSAANAVWTLEKLVKEWKCNIIN